jgi:mRNA interferase RelE/StbE
MNYPAASSGVSNHVSQSIRPQGAGNLPGEIKNRIGTTLLRFKDNPLQHAERLTDSELGGYRFRIGDYHVIFDIEGNDIVEKKGGQLPIIFREEEKPGRLPFFAQRKWGVVPAFPGRMRNH